MGLGRKVLRNYISDVRWCSQIRKLIRVGKILFIMKNVTCTTYLRHETMIPLLFTLIRTRLWNTSLSNTSFSSCRVRLHEKYSRHLSDMKSYYEAEIRALRDDLAARRDTQTMTSRDFDSVSRDVDRATFRSRCQILEEQNKILSARVEQLEVSLAETQRWVSRKNVMNVKRCERIRIHVHSIRVNRGIAV